MNSVEDTACAVGCPIRKFTDQNLLAVPRDLSQRATSFIASQCQGIHQMPFRRLISQTKTGAPRAGTNPLTTQQFSPPFRCMTSNQRVTLWVIRRTEVCPRSLALSSSLVHDPASITPWGRLRHTQWRKPSCVHVKPCCVSFQRSSFKLGGNP
jgi:hypothetical protein